jgi:hypothetical protein
MRAITLISYISVTSNNGYNIDNSNGYVFRLLSYAVIRYFATEFIQRKIYMFLTLKNYYKGVQMYETVSNTKHNISQKLP